MAGVRQLRLVVIVLIPIAFLVPAALVFLPPLMPLTPAPLPRIMEHSPRLKQTLYTKDALNRTFLFDVEKRTCTLKLIALSNLLGVHGLFRSLVVAFLAVAVHSNSGLRTAIIRMLVFHRNTSALPVHGAPCEGRILHPLSLKNDLLSSPRTTPAGGRGHAPRENALEKCP